MTTTKTQIEVKPGQVWADNDWRARGRTLRVDALTRTKWPAGIEENVGEGGKPPRFARCTVLTDREEVDGYGPAKSAVGKTVWIRLDRFRPTSTGYRLVSDPPTTGEP